AAAEIDLVEVAGEDLIHRHTRLEPERYHQLVDLPAERPLAIEIKNAGELLRDRAAALSDIAGDEVRHGGSGEADRVDAEMAVESSVLDRDHGGRDIGRQLGQFDHVADEGAARAEPVTVAVRKDQGGRLAAGAPIFLPDRQGQEE